MAIEYFKNIKQPFPAYADAEFTFTAVGDPIKDHSETNTQLPYSTVYGKFTPTEYTPNFDNSDSLIQSKSVKLTGLSKNAFTKANAHLFENGGTEDSKSYINIIQDLNARHQDENNLTFGSPEHHDYLAKVNSGFYDKLEKDAVKRTSTHPYFQQDTLFDTTPSTVHIEGMFSDPRMNSTAITLVALAKKHFNPEQIQAGYDLSKHSSKLVKNAVEKGLVVPHPNNPNANRKNDIGITDRTMTPNVMKIHLKGDEPVPASDVQAANLDLRETLRGRRDPVVRNNTPVTPKGLSAQFLPGMEGFV
jgi:hypothetical protein